MKILNALRARSSGREGTSVPLPEGGDPDDQPVPISHYDGQDPKKVNEQLPGLSQVELESVEEHERANKARPEVLAKLHYLRQREPVEGYDAMETTEVVKLLADADAQTVKAVRDYERKFARRNEVLTEAARVLPSSTPSAQEDRSREEKAERVRASRR